MKIRNILFVALSAMVVSCGQTKNDGKMEGVGIEPGNMNTEANPGLDFFEYANGGWLKKNPIPDEYSRYGAFEVLGKKNEEQIKAIVEEASSLENVTKGSPAQQIRDFYNSGMDTVLIEELGIKPIEPIIAEINNVQNKEEMIKMQARLNMIGVHPLFAVFGSQNDNNSQEIIAHTIQGGIGLPDRDYYTRDDERTANIRNEYMKHLQKMFEIAGYEESKAKNAADVVMNLETGLAKVSMTMMERRDPNATNNIRNIDQLVDSIPNYNIKSYFTALNISNTETINIRQPKFMQGMGDVFKSTSLNDLKTYFIWNVINENASKLSSDFVNQNFYFYSTVLSGVETMKPRWKRMISSTNGNLGDPVGKIYVEKHFPAESKERMMELCTNLKFAFKETIENLDWMSGDTKVKAQEKLETMNVKVGYPNKWIDYSNVEITSDAYVQNVWNCNEFNYKRNLNKIGKPVDREEWHMTPQTVNAYYSPNMNEIVFPAAILQPPFFDAKADDAVNYGAIGVVIGHEMTHGFDDQGKKYDKDGNLNNWWTEQDAENFKNKSQILVEQYNNFEILDSLHVDGELTLGENIADNGGLFISYAALQKAYADNGTPSDIDDLTSDQRFLISYAQLWRQHIRDEMLMRRLQEDVHSPGVARVNGGVANLPWWYTAFDITEDDKFYIAPENRAKIW